MSKNETKQMYGIAILMMLCLHLFRAADPTNYFSILNIVFGKNALLYIANFCGICVAIYAFITGYGFSEYSKRKKFLYSSSDFKELSRYIIKHIVGLYRKYWLVFLIFVPFGYLTKSYDGYGIKTIILSLLGLDSSFCGAWWYVWQYVVLCTVFPLIMILFDVLDGIKKKNTDLKFRNATMIFFLFSFLTIVLWAKSGSCSSQPMCMNRKWRRRCRTLLKSTEKHKTIKPPSSQHPLLFSFPKPPSPRTCLIRKACTSPVQQKKRESVSEQNGSGDTER